MDMNVYEVIERIAEKHGVTPQQVREDMEQAVALTFSGAPTACAARLFDGETPSLYRLITTLAAQCR